jgi:hypothetical protein
MTLPSRTIPRLILCLGVAELVAFAAASILTTQPAPSSAALTQPVNNGGAGRIPPGASPEKPAKAGGRTLTAKTTERLGNRTDSGVSAASASPNTARLAGLFAAIRHVESGGNDRAVGDGGRSHGPLQIGRAYWHDAWGTYAGWPCYDYRRSCETVLRYWRKHCPRALAAGDVATLAKVHTGVPDGASKSATGKYCAKVKAAMKGTGR